MQASNEANSLNGDTSIYVVNTEKHGQNIYWMIAANKK